MRADGLVYAGRSDIYTSESEKLGDDKLYDRNGGRGIKFDTPDTMINNTNYGYNELDYNFIQGGKKIQPNYIMAFRKNGKIEHIDEVLAGAKSWAGKLPIVIIDVDKCLISERGKIDDKLSEYNLQKTPQLAQEILQKVRNNRQTDREFGKDIQIHDIERWLKEHGKEEGHETKKVSMADMVANNRTVGAQDRKEGISAMRMLRDKLQEVVNKREGEDIEQ